MVGGQIYLSWSWSDQLLTDNHETCLYENKFEHISSQVALFFAGILTDISTSTEWIIMIYLLLQKEEKLFFDWKTRRLGAVFPFLDF